VNAGVNIGVNSSMKRIAIIGSGGAGKTTLALALERKTGIPALHLDRLYWKAGWVATAPEDWLKIQGNLLERPRWIIDGNYGSTLDMRLAAADTVVFLDMPRLLCLWRALKRGLRYAGRSRPDMTEGCPERVTGEFLRWIWRYPLERRPVILEKLAALKDKRVVRLRTRHDVGAFLDTCGDTQG
jgi:adenylate kinase family enzyme